MNVLKFFLWSVLLMSCASMSGLGLLVMMGAH